MRNYPLKQIAIFVSGLGQDARIYRNEEQRFRLDTLLLMYLVDIKNLELWSRSKEGTPKPNLLLNRFLNSSQEIRTPEEFERIRKEIQND